MQSKRKPTRIPHLLVISAPSGAGKTTIAHYLLRKYPFLQFSVSATTRPQRPGEINGKDYFFLDRSHFEQLIREGKLLEYEQIFGHYYGTLKETVESALKAGKVLVFDVDVKGALSIQQAYPGETLLVFVAPPDLATLEQRLRQRRTESEEELQQRLQRARMEMNYQQFFDEVIINDNLEHAFAQADHLVQRYYAPLLEQQMES